MNCSCNNGTNMTVDVNTTGAVSRPTLYIFNPVNKGVKLAIACPAVVSGVEGLVANSLILYFMYKKPKIRTGPFRRSLTDFFIQSLAVSDVLCSLINLPFFVTEMFVDYITNDTICKLARYVMYFFPVVTCMNYLFIGLERFMGVYFPFNAPSDTLCKRLVVVAWCIGALITCLSIPAMVLVRFDLPYNKYTLLCMYDKSVSYRRIFFLLFTLFFYLLPFVILTITCIMIVRKLRRQNVPGPFRACDDPSSHQQNAQESARQYKVTYMFLSLICAFFIPYLLFVFYNGAANILKLDADISADYAARFLAGAFAYANGAIGSTILFRHSSFLRRNIIGLFRKIVSRNEILPQSSQTDSKKNDSNEVFIVQYKCKERESNSHSSVQMRCVDK